MTLANKITVVRIVTIPAFLIALLNQSYQLSILIGGLSGITDALDGLIARKFKQHTPLGRFLDPLADKLLLLAAFGGLVYNRDISAWVLVVTLSRDLIVFIGWMLLYLLTHISEVTTRRSGKVSTAAQMIFVAIVLLSKGFESIAKISVHAIGLLQGLTVALTIFSMLDYVIYGSKKLTQSGQN
ncbi:MAG: CDP-alcohol phosphatidyltransferase family protein [Elusimicrobia bacterium]|nr:CDP-alcohol phosphatidyltransferase family protein [Elusimicrobiota bacterium]